MKIQKRLAILTVTAIAATFITQAKAQYQPTGNDGITASPKVRAMLNERARSAATASAVGDRACCQATANADVAASPKVRQLQDQNKAWTSAPASAEVVVTQARTAGDGIAASPKMRALLDERTRHEVQIAPLK